MPDPNDENDEHVVITGPRASGYLTRVPIRWPRVATIDTAADVAEVCDAIDRFPVVVKAEGLSHRNQVGAVWTDVLAADAEVAARAFGQRFGFPITLSEQIRHGQEFILGARTFRNGDVLCLVGRGGTGVGDEVDFLLAPARQGQLIDALHEHVQDREHVRQLAAALVALEECLTGDGDGEIAAVDLNPVAFDDATDQLYALDAKVFLRRA